LEQSKLPYVVEFEYGGGAIMQSGNGGWSSNFFDKVIAIIQTLQNLGYEQGLIIDSNDIVPAFFDLKTIRDPRELFKPNYEYGNFLAFKNAVPNIIEFENLLLKAQTLELEKQLRNITAENAALSIKILKAQYLKRVINKTKKIFKKSGR